MPNLAPRSRIQAPAIGELETYDLGEDESVATGPTVIRESHAMSADELGLYTQYRAAFATSAVLATLAVAAIPACEAEIACPLAILLALCGIALAFFGYEKSRMRSRAHQELLRRYREDPAFRREYDRRTSV